MAYIITQSLKKYTTLIDYCKKFSLQQRQIIAIKIVKKIFQAIILLNRSSIKFVSLCLSDIYIYQKIDLTSQQDRKDSDKSKKPIQNNIADFQVKLLYFFLEDKFLNNKQLQLAKKNKFYFHYGPNNKEKIREAATCQNIVWTLGVILYYIMFGQYPFTDSTKDPQQEIITKLNKYENVKVQIKMLIRMMLQSSLMEKIGKMSEKFVSLSIPTLLTKIYDIFSVRQRNEKQQKSEKQEREIKTYVTSLLEHSQRKLWSDIGEHKNKLTRVGQKRQKNSNAKNMPNFYDLSHSKIKVKKDWFRVYEYDQKYEIYQINIRCEPHEGKEKKDRLSRIVEHYENRAKICHNNLLKVYECFKQYGYLYIVTQLRSQPISDLWEQHNEKKVTQMMGRIISAYKSVQQQCLRHCIGLELRNILWMNNEIKFVGREFELENVAFEEDLVGVIREIQQNQQIAQKSDNVKLFVEAPYLEEDIRSLGKAFYYLLHRRTPRTRNGDYHELEFDHRISEQVAFANRAMLINKLKYKMTLQQLGDVFSNSSNEGGFTMIAKGFKNLGNVFKDKEQMEIKQRLQRARMKIQAYLKQQTANSGSFNFKQSDQNVRIVGKYRQTIPQNMPEQYVLSKQNILTQFEDIVVFKYQNFAVISMYLNFFLKFSHQKSKRSRTNFIKQYLNCKRTKIGDEFILKVYECFEQDGNIYIITQLFQQFSIESLNPPQKRIFPFIYQIVLSFQNLYQKQLEHRFTATCLTSIVVCKNNFKYISFDIVPYMSKQSENDWFKSIEWLTKIEDKQLAFQNNDNANLFNIVGQLISLVLKYKNLNITSKQMAQLGWSKKITILYQRFENKKQMDLIQICNLFGIECQANKRRLKLKQQISKHAKQSKSDKQSKSLAKNKLL